MPRWIYFIALSLTIASALAAECAAQQDGAAKPEGMSAELHPWGRFEPGAWKLVRVVTETLDENGQVVSSSTTDTKTTLIAIDDEGVTLEIQTCMEVAGKSFQAEPQTIRQSFNGEIISAELKPKESEEGDESVVTIEDRKIDCKVQRLESVGPNEKVSISLYYSPNVAPYILRRVGVVSDPEGKEIRGTAVFEVIAFDMPVELRGKIHSGIYVRTTHKNGNGSSATLAVVLPEVPGGLIRHSSKELDKSGRVVRRGTLNLVDYGVEPEEDRVGYFLGKRAARRAAKSVSRRGGK